MKLAVTQMVLGALIMMSIFLFVEYVIPGYYDEVMIDSNGNVIGHVLGGLHKPNVLLDIWSIIYPVLGLAVFGCGLAQYLQARRKTTTIALTNIQIILGLLILASLVVFIFRVEPRFEPYTKFIENGTREVIVQKDHNWVVLQISWKVVSLLLAISVLGCGIAQRFGVMKRRLYHAN